MALSLDRVEVALVHICGRLPTYQIRWKSEKTFVDVRTDGRTATPEFQSTRSSVGDDLIEENSSKFNESNSLEF